MKIESHHNEPDVSLSKYEAELFLTYPSWKGRYRVVGTLGANDDISVSSLHDKFKQKIPTGWTIGTSMQASDGRYIVTVNDPSQSS